MARGRSPGYDEQRETILARAAESFAERGFVGTSMNQVAEACGLSKPALYHYYRDKQALLANIAEGHLARLLGLVDEVWSRPLEPEPRLRALIGGFVREYAGARHAHRVLTEDVRFLGAPEQARVLETERLIVAGVARAIAAARPELSQARLTKPLSMLLFGMINWLFTWVRPDGELDYDAIAPLVTDLFVGGLPAVAASVVDTAVVEI
ncbi:MAG: TetR/AcrR family transcriptional regulator [Burkholderiaceae bacterium]